MNCYVRRFLTPLERFESFVEYIPFSGCWNWTGATDEGQGKLEYGKFWLREENRSVQAHRFSWEAFRGPIPNGFLVLHKCDNARCVNPEHLFLGTSKDNTHDMIHKGRHMPMVASRRGTNSNFAKLTEEQAREIKYAGGKQREVAARFGICQTAVSLIRSGKNWKHV